MRVEQLAAAAGVPVDTVRYYQSRGLLDPPRREGRIAWYGTPHLERLARIRELQARGLSLATIGRLLRGELDASDEALVQELTAPPGATEPERNGAVSAAGAAVAGSPTPQQDEGGVTGAEEPDATFTLVELADRTGVPFALLKAVEAEGLLIPRRIGTAERYTSEDVAAARAGLLLLEHGIPLGALLDLARRHHAATEHTAEAAVDLFATYIREPLRTPGPDEEAGVTAGGAPDGDGATAALLEAYTTLLPAVTALVGHHFTRALTRAALARLEGDGTPTEQRLVDLVPSDLGFSIESRPNAHSDRESGISASGGRS
jgi:DNA-binding transcriptional MerR regulator